MFTNHTSVLYIWFNLSYSQMFDTLLLHTTSDLDLLLNRTGTNNNMFPPLNVKGANLHLIEPRKPSDLPLADIQKVSSVYYMDMYCEVFME